MLCHVDVVLPHFLHVLLPWQLVDISQTLPFSFISACISHLALSCLAIDQNSFIYHSVRATHTHSVQKDHSTALVGHFLQRKGELHNNIRNEGKEYRTCEPVLDR